MAKKEPSREELLSENADLRREVAELKSEKEDLELMIEMSAEHSDNLEGELLSKVESTLRESEKRFRLITETIPVPVIITRFSDSSVVYLNKRATCLFGRSVEDILEKRTLDFFYKNPQDRRTLLEKLSKHGYLSDYELKAKRADGSTIWVSLFIQTLIFNEEPCMLTALYDLTERRKMEEEIRKLNLELKQRIKEREGKYLLFMLEDECYGISILKIKEIMGLMPITSVPGMPDFLKGVINLRGRVFPVIELRLRFGMKALDYTEQTCIILVELDGTTDKMMIGLIVDSVLEVLSIKGESIEDPPGFGCDSNTDYILGMAKIEGKVRILLNTNKLFNRDHVDGLKSIW